MNMARRIGPSHPLGSSGHKKIIRLNKKYDKIQTQIKKLERKCRVIKEKIHKIIR